MVRRGGAGTGLQRLARCRVGAGVGLSCLCGGCRIVTRRGPCVVVCRGSVGPDNVCFTVVVVSGRDVFSCRLGMPPTVFFYKVSLSLSSSSSSNLERHHALAPVRVCGETDNRCNHPQRRYPFFGDIGVRRTDGSLPQRRVIWVALLCRFEMDRRCMTHSRLPEPPLGDTEGRGFAFRSSLFSLASLHGGVPLTPMIYDRASLYSKKDADDTTTKRQVNRLSSTGWQCGL